LRKTEPIEHAEPVRVLLVDDDSFMRHALRVSLIARGYVVEEAESGEAGIQAVSQKAIDLVLLDVNMPGISGLEACESIRALRPAIGILMLTVRDAEENIVAALEAGADDYITKPFRFGELVARMRAVERRIRAEAPPTTDILRIGQLEMDLKRRTLKKAGRDVRLSPTEFNLLAYLMRRPGVPVSHTKLLRAVWGPEYGRELEYLRTYFKMLRKKIEDDPARPEYIVTEPWLGYRLRDPSRPGTSEKEAEDDEAQSS
jgi:two-component system KDP operon response regulator KdpE